LQTSPKPIVGVIGGIGSGKSFVAGLLARRGGWLIPADQLGHEALLQDHVKHELVTHWGNRILKPTGDIDRRALGAIVFADDAERKALEAVVFPYIDQRIFAEIALANATSDAKFIILDAAILLETGWDEHCDKIIFVDTPRAERLKRLQAQRGWSEAELDRREAAQMPLHEKRRRADAILDNTGEPASLEPAIDRLLRSWGIVMGT
jgi:dephospho-CoA kinase